MKGIIIMTNYGETKKRYRKLEFLQEGEYEGVITEVASSQTRDGACLLYTSQYWNEKYKSYDFKDDVAKTKNIGSI